MESARKALPKRYNLRQETVVSVVRVTCYFRHLKTVFQKAGIEVTSENRQEVDLLIHGIIGAEYKDCPATWREVKKRMVEDEEGFVSKLRAEWKKRV